MQNLSVEALILWQNENRVVVDKPPDCLSVPSRLGAKDPRPCLGSFLQSSLGIQIWPTHRLDYEVSGVILFAKSKLAHTSANHWFENRVIKKSYEAYSLGPVGAEHLSGKVWHSTLVRGKRRTFAAAHGQPAETVALCLGPLTKGAEVFGWRLQPRTGRPHQLRFEMSHRGFAVLGDQLYGGRAWKQMGIALRSTEIDFSEIPEAQRLGLPQKVRGKSLKSLDVVIE